VPEAMVSVVERLAQNFYICASTPAQHAALACFTPESLAICESRRRTLIERRQLVLDRLATMGLPVPASPDGAFYVYIDIAETGLGAAAFCERALTDAHVALTPGKDFGPHGADRYVRLSYASADADLATGLDRLAGFMAQLGWR
jgi:aspartate/methionine/tyrosine aminotransferase